MTPAKGLHKVRQLVRNDAFAITFQSSAQYRESIIKQIDKELEEHEGQAAWILGLLRRIEWSGELAGWLVCPDCKNRRKDGHAMTCGINEAIKTLKEETK